METVSAIFTALEEEEPREPEETVAVGDVRPSWMTPLEDFTIGTTAYRWYRLVPSIGDVAFESCGGEDGDPFWLEDTSYGDILRSGYKLGNVQWALELGISPGQPFLICFEKPVWAKSGGYDGPEEWDADYPWEVVWILPRRDRTAADAWDRALQSIRRYEARIQRRKEADLERRLACPRRWALEGTFQGEVGKNLTLTLRCKFKRDWYGGTALASGSSQAKSNDERYKEAFWRLVANFQTRYPTLDPYLVTRLAGDLVPISKWDHLRLQGGEDHPEL